MGKGKLYLGIAIGAVTGGLVSLLDSDVRHYTKTKMIGAKMLSSYYIKRPSEAVRTSRQAVERFNGRLAQNTDNAINALEQVENTIDQFTTENDQQELSQE